MPKYSEDLNRILSNDLYFNVLEKKGVKYLNIRKTIDFEYLKDFAIQLSDQEIYWSGNDNLFKVSLKAYGTGEYWWAIALVNRKPTDGHWKIGDQILLPSYPVELEGILS